jgi:chaperone modulatory protein CbpM
MPVHITESIWLNTTGLCSFQQLVEVSGLSSDDLRELIDMGAIEPAETANQTMFRLESIVIARKARRLRDDFELDISGLALALQLLQRIDRLEHELHSLTARLGQQGDEPTR